MIFDAYMHNGGNHMNKRITIKKLLSILTVLTMIFTLFVSATQVVNAAGVYYVAINGDDNNPGTEASPWRTITRAANTMVAGDTVYVRAGTYHERVMPANSGTPGNFISYKRYGTDTVTIDGTGVPVLDLGYLSDPAKENGLFDIRKSYIKVDGFRIWNSDFAGVMVNTDLGGLAGAELSNIYIENCDIQNNASSGMSLYKTDGLYILNNYFENNQTMAGLPQQRQETCSLLGCTNFEVSNNTFYNNGMETLDCKVGCSYGKIFGNDISGHISSGIYLDAWDAYEHDIEIYNNRIHDSTNSGARGISLGVENYGTLEDITVYNNIIYNNPALGITTTWYSNGPMDDIKIINNTVYNNGTVDNWGGGIIQDYPAATNVIIRNNIADGNNHFSIKVSVNCTATVDYNLIHDFKSASYETKGTNYQEGDPMFVNPGSSDFHIQSSSIAKDHGTSSLAPSFDYDGVTRPQEFDYDIGAYEYTGGGPTPMPNDVDALYGLLYHGEKNNLITNNGVLYSLKAKVDNMLNNIENARNVFNGLNAFQNEVLAQSGKKIESGFASILLRNVEYLMNLYEAGGPTPTPTPAPTPTPTQAPTPTPVPAPSNNLALNKAATVSSAEVESLPGSNAVDGNTGTRWASLYSDPQWIYVDLGANYYVNRVILNWEAAYASGYQIQVSDDAANWTDVYSTATGDGGVDDVSFAAASARYVRMYGTARATQYGYSLWEFEVYGNLALNKTVTVSSVEVPSLPGSYAVDGNTGTRWSSVFTDPQWIYVDLGADYNVSRVILNWEAAYASAYQIQVSNDTTNWTDVYSTTTGDGGIDDVSFVSTSARYVRMYGTTRATQYGYSLWEFEVYGP